MRIVTLLPFITLVVACATQTDPVSQGTEVAQQDVVESTASPAAPAPTTNEMQEDVAPPSVTSAAPPIPVPTVSEDDVGPDIRITARLPPGWERVGGTDPGEDVVLLKYANPKNGAFVRIERIVAKDFDPLKAREQEFTVQQRRKTPVMRLEIRRTDGRDGLPCVQMRKEGIKAGAPIEVQCFVRETPDVSLRYVAQSFVGSKTGVSDEINAVLRSIRIEISTGDGG